MKRISLIGLLLSSISIYAQKKIELKKGDLLADGQKVATYDNKGGVLSTDRNFWVLAPDSQDTILSIKQITVNFDNPMFESWIYYKVDIKGADASSFYLKNPIGWGSVGEKRVIGFLFNEKLPLIIENGKINTEALNSVKATTAYNFDSLMLLAKQVSDTAKTFTKSIIVRNKKEAIIYKPVADRNYFPKFYTPLRNTSQKIEIYQDSKLIGAVEKELAEGTFAKGNYVVYKVISPIVINGLTISLLPIAIANTSPGITSAVTSDNIYVKSMEKQQLAIVPPAVFNQAESQIVKALVDADLL